MKVKLTQVRLSFPDLFEPRAFKPGDKPKYKATFLIEKDSVLDCEVWAAIKEVAAAKWGKKADSVINSIKGNANKFNYQDGDTKEYDGYAGMMALSAGNAARPLVLDRVGVKRDQDKDPSRNYTSPNKDGVMFPILTAADGKPYAGCYVTATIEFFAYDNSGNGISANLKGVQFVKDGDAFGGGAPASPDDFDDLGVDETADDLAG